VATYSKGHGGLPAANTWYVGILDTSNGQTSWETALPGLPLHDGLALGRNGDIHVMLQSGDLVCYGSGSAVSVVRQSPKMPSLSTEQSPAARAYTSPPLPGVELCSAAGVQTAQAPVSTPTQLASATPPSLVLSAPVAASHESPVATGLVTREALGAVVDAPRSSVPQPAPRARRDMHWKPDRPCLAVAAVRASSCAAGRDASNTSDRDLRTHWAPAAPGTQWLLCDLGSLREVSAASVVWYSAKPASVMCAIEVSADGATYEQVDAGRLQGRGTLETVRSFVPVSARFVRVALTPAEGACAPRVCELGIHGGVAEAQAMGR